MSQVCGSLGKGGGCTDGNTGRTFFSTATLPAILQCVDEKDKDDVKTLLKDLSAGTSCDIQHG